MKIFSAKFHSNPSIRSRADTWRKDRRTNTTKVIDPFPDYSNARKIPEGGESLRCLKLLEHLDPGFEFHPGHGYVSCVFAVLCMYRSGEL